MTKPNEARVIVIGRDDTRMTVIPSGFKNVRILVSEDAYYNLDTEYISEERYQKLINFQEPELPELKGMTNEEAVQKMVDRIKELETEQTKLRTALNGYQDSNLVSLAETLNVSSKQAEKFYEALRGIQKGIDDRDPTFTYTEIQDFIKRTIDGIQVEKTEEPPGGAIMCPHCGTFTAGCLDLVCEQCGNLYWSRKKMEKALELP